MLLPLHATPVASPQLVGILLLAGLGSAVLLGLGLAAYVRRRSRPYLLVALVFVALAARTLLAGLTLTQQLPDTQHHLYEHSLDVVMAALVIAAVFSARTTTPTGGTQ